MNVPAIFQTITSVRIDAYHLDCRTRCFGIRIRNEELLIPGSLKVHSPEDPSASDSGREGLWGSGVSGRGERFWRWRTLTGVAKNIPGLFLYQFPNVIQGEFGKTGEPRVRHLPVESLDVEDV